MVVWNPNLDSDVIARRRQVERLARQVDELIVHQRAGFRFFVRLYFAQGGERRARIQPAETVVVTHSHSPFQTFFDTSL